MIMSDKRRIGALLCAMMMQFSAHGITSTKAYIGTALVGFAGAAVVVSNKNDDRAAILGAFAMSVACAYCCLRRYTPAFVLNKRETEIKKVKEVINVDDTVVFDPKSLSYDNMRCLTETERNEYIHAVEVKFCYIPTNKLAVAHEAITPLLSHVNENAQAELLAIQNDAKADGLLREWNKIENSRQHCFYGVKKALLLISGDQNFKEQHDAYQAEKKSSRVLQIEQQKADAKTTTAAAQTVKATAALKSANAHKKEADAIESIAVLQWLKWIVSLPYLLLAGKTG